MRDKEEGRRSKKKEEERDKKYSKKDENSIEIIKRQNKTTNRKQINPYKSSAKRKKREIPQGRKKNDVQRKKESVSYRKPGQGCRGLFKLWMSTAQANNPSV